MPWTRRSESTPGLWTSTVYTPRGRITESHELRSVIHNWALDLEAEIRRGEFIDPRGAKTSLRLVWEQYAGARRLEKNSRLRDDSTWRCWVEPRWGTLPVGSILKPDAQTWINELEEDGVGGWTIIAAANVLKAACELAVDAGLVRANPARRVKTPMPPAHEARVITGDEEDLILGRCDVLFPGRRDARPFIEGLFETGTRWEELAAVKREAVDLRAGLISIGPVMERDGTIRDYPKGARHRQAAGFRDAPVGDSYLATLKPLVLATKPGDVVFCAPEGGHLLYPTWKDRLWDVVIHGAPAKRLQRAPGGAYDPATFGVWLDEQRAALGGTDRAIARAAGIGPSLIANWRAGRFGPTRARAEKLAAGLGLPVDDVLRVAGLLVDEIPPAYLDAPTPTPHDTRHSYGTRLADAGVEQHHRMALMGQKDERSARRYTHSNEARFDMAREALERFRRDA